MNMTLVGKTQLAISGDAAEIKRTLDILLQGKQVDIVARTEQTLRLSVQTGRQRRARIEEQLQLAFD